MNETNIMRSIMAAISKPGTRVFRQNTGVAWQGDVRKNPDGSITIRNPRPIHAGLCKGSSDLIGWKSVLVASHHVGKRLAVFLAIETKGKRTVTTPEQTNFLDRVKSDGGLAGIARSVDDAQQITNQIP